MIKAILFDFDGVICDTEPVNFNYKLEKMHEMGFPVTKEFLLSRVGESFSVMFPREFPHVENPEKYVEEKGLKMESDEENLKEIVKEVLEANPMSVNDYKNGKERAMGFLVGQTMKATKGKANPGVINKILKELLQK